jgi:hypothetical protein
VEKQRLKISEKRVLRKRFGPRDEIKGDRWTLHNEELHDLYSSPNIIGMIKSKMMRSGYVARMGRNSHRFWRESQKERDH